MNSLAQVNDRTKQEIKPKIASKLISTRYGLERPPDQRKTFLCAQDMKWIKSGEVGVVTLRAFATVFADRLPKRVELDNV